MKNKIPKRFGSWHLIILIVAVNIFLANYADNIFHGNATVILFRKFPSSDVLLTGKLIIYKSPSYSVYPNVGNFKLFEPGKPKLTNISKQEISKIFTSSDNEKVTDKGGYCKIEYSPSDMPGFIFIEQPSHHHGQLDDKIRFIDAKSAFMKGNVLIFTVGEFGLHIVMSFFCSIIFYLIVIHSLRKLLELRLIN